MNIYLEAVSMYALRVVGCVTSTRKCGNFDKSDILMLFFTHRGHVQPCNLSCYPSATNNLVEN